MIFFVADLHLATQTPQLLALFERFAAEKARSACELYILGDLFAYWVGDDDLAEPGNARVVSALRRLAASGVRVSVMRGNRDFLLGDAFAAAADVRLLPDPYILSTAEWQFVLSHGDFLCTDDRPYQEFRAATRRREWQADFLQKPLAERRAIANALREQSAESARDRAIALDLNPIATDDFLRSSGYATFIHGHTHRPAVHQHLVDGISVERWVIGDWRASDEAASPAASPDAPAPPYGEYLVWDGQTLTRKFFC